MYSLSENTENLKVLTEQQRRFTNHLLEGYQVRLSCSVGRMDFHQQTCNAMVVYLLYLKSATANAKCSSYSCKQGHAERPCAAQSINMRKVQASLKCALSFIWQVQAINPNNASYIKGTDICPCPFRETGEFNLTQLNELYREVLTLATTPRVYVKSDPLRKHSRDQTIGQS